MFKHILLATDGSPTSEQAAKLAVDLARVHGANITALYVVDPYPYLGIGEANPYGFQAYMSAAQELGVQAHAKVAAMCSAGGTTVQMTPRVVEDVAAYRGIVDTAEAENADHHCDGLARAHWFTPFVTGQCGRESGSASIGAGAGGALGICRWVPSAFS
jgi:nucleotide-binding universal stress UspA family protein